MKGDRDGFVFESNPGGASWVEARFTAADPANYERGPKPWRRYSVGGPGGLTIDTNVEGFDPTALRAMTPDKLRKIVEGE